MSDSLADASFDEEKYANDSFETEVPESSFNGSDNDFDDLDVKKQLQQLQQKKLKQQQHQPPSMSMNKKTSQFTRNGEFMTCESSSDEDDVILGETIAEINTEPIDFDDDNIDEDEHVDRDDGDGAGENSQTPAQRIFQMASASRCRREQKTTNNIFPTPPNSKESVTNDEMPDDYEDDYELSDCDEFEALEREVNAVEKNYRQYAKLTSHEEFATYAEEQIIFGSGIEMDEVYENISIEDGGEVDVGEPNIGEELGEEEQEIDQELVSDELTDEDVDAANSEKVSISSHSESDEEAAAAGGGDGAGDCAAGAGGRVDGGEENRNDNRSLRADDSMESFKRRVMHSQRMRCQSEGAGDCAYVRSTRSLKSSIPVWTGVKRASGSGPRLIKSSRDFSGAAMSRISKSKLTVGSRASLPEFNEKSETERSEKYIDSAAGGDYTDMSLTDGASTFDGNPSSYERELERFLKAGTKAKPPKKLKAGERRNKSFSNERLRDIERSNHILLRKIINQKPTVSSNDKKKKNDKFASLPPTTRLSSAEINRKKQERQIAMDNQLFKRKLDAILQRKPKIKK